MRKIFKRKTYHDGWDDGFSVGTEAALRLVLSMLERKLHKRKNKSVQYRNAVEDMITKIKGMKYD